MVHPVAVAHQIALVYEIPVVHQVAVGHQIVVVEVERLANLVARSNTSVGLAPEQQLGLVLGLLLGVL